MSDLPYSGLNVLEMGSRIAAGACGRMLADLGATVYVLQPHAGAGAVAHKWRDRVSALAGKQCIVADPASASDVAAVTALIDACDVVIASPDVDGALPAEWAEAVAHCPIVCDITAFGSSGPLAGQPADERTLQALTGVLVTTGLPDGPATPVGVPVLEMSAALYAAGAIATALHVQRREGRGQRVEVALYDVGINALTTFMPAHLAGLQPRRLGNGHGMAVPWNAYPTADGWVLICSTNDAQWRRIAQMVDPALAQDTRYAELRDRLSHREAIDARIAAWTRGLALETVGGLLGAQGIPCGGIVPVAGLAQEPNLALRETVRQVTDPSTGRPVQVTGAFIRLDDARPPSPAIPQAQPVTRLTLPARRPVPVAPGAGPQAGVPALAGLRVVEIGQLTTAPLAARHLASFGADVIKIEPPEGESARSWAPLREGVSHFFVASNGSKRSLALDLRDAAGAQRLAALLAEADVLVENMKPGTLARLGFSPQRLAQINPQLVYCAISGFGVRSVYEGRPAVDTVIQAMSGMMDATRSGDVPLKTGISTADIAGGETGFLAILAALARRERTGRGGMIDISMQDVAAWMTQSLWNPAAGRPVEAPPPASPPPSTVAEACTHPQTLARELIVTRTDPEGRSWEVFGSPMRLSATPARIGTLIGAPCAGPLAWTPRAPDAPPGRDEAARARPLD